MARQSINTDSVKAATNKLRTANNNINREFQTLEKAAKCLEGDWKSVAGSVAHTTAYRLLLNSKERSAVLLNYIDILEQQVNPGYIEAEKENMMFSKLADQFK